MYTMIQYFHRTSNEPLDGIKLIRPLNYNVIPFGEWIYFSAN